MRNLFFRSSKPRFVDEKKVISEFKHLALRAAQKNKNVEGVYLFGSYAENKAAIYSDVDILVVLSDDKRRMFDRLDEFILEFSDGPVPVDVLVYTRAELEKAIEDGNHFLERAMKGEKLV